MDTQDLRSRAHGLEVTVWVGKAGIDAVAGELADQLEDRELVKVRFLSARSPDVSVDDEAAALAERVGAAVVETRGHTAVFH